MDNFFQLNPTWNASGFFRLDVNFVEVTFIAEKMSPLSVTRFSVTKCKRDPARVEKTQVTGKFIRTVQVLGTRYRANE